MTCGTCPYTGLNGLLITPALSEEAVEVFTPKTAATVARQYLQQEEGVAVALLGYSNDLSRRAMIVDAKTGAEQPFEFNRTDDGYLVGQGCLQKATKRDVAQPIIALQQLVLAAAAMVDEAYRAREGNYSLISSGSKGCCTPSMGWTEVSDRDIGAIVMSTCESLDRLVAEPKVA